MLSHPSRVRGLKQVLFVDESIKCYVAPLAGAWIETLRLPDFVLPPLVAPLAGAWIETTRDG